MRPPSPEDDVIVARPKKKFQPPPPPVAHSRPRRTATRSHHGRADLAAIAPTTSTSTHFLSFSPLVSLALNAGFLHLPAAPRPESRALSRFPPGLQHVLTLTQPPPNPLNARRSSAAASSTTARPTAHGLSPSTARQCHAAVSPSSRLSPASAGTANGYNLIAAQPRPRSALSAPAKPRAAHDVRWQAQEGDQASHKDGLLDVS